MEEHFFHELRVLNVASSNTMVTCLHASLREIDRYQAVYPIPGQELMGSNYGYINPRGQSFLLRMEPRQSPKCLSFPENAFGFPWCHFDWDDNERQES